MSSIPQARKQAILNKMLSANPPTVSALSKQEGIPEATLTNWRKQLRLEGRSVPEPDRTSENWSAATKFAIVVETASLPETELAEYCRGKGLYPEQVKAWREAAVSAQDSSAQAAADKQEQARDYRKQIKRLEREIARKDKALAEAAALLVLQKKIRALWEGARKNDLPGRAPAHCGQYRASLRGRRFAAASLRSGRHLAQLLVPLAAGRHGAARPATTSAAPGVGQQAQHRGAPPDPGRVQQRPVWQPARCGRGT